MSGSNVLSKEETKDKVPERDKDLEPSSNPFAEAMGITVTLPEIIDIKMVDATVLSDYEVWLLISSVLATATVGFIVAFLQDIGNIALLCFVIILAILFAIAIIMTAIKRNLMKRRTKTIRLKTSMVEKLE